MTHPVNTDKKKNKKSRKYAPKGRQVNQEAKIAVQTLLGNESRQRDLLIEHLHKIQDKYHCLSTEHLVALSKEMKLSKAAVFEVASFYHHFDIVDENDTKPANLTIRVCNSVSCQMAGGKALIQSLKQTLGDKVRVQAVPCIGRCEQAPLAVVGLNPIAKATVAKVKLAVDEKQIQPERLNAIDYENYLQSGGYQLYQRCLQNALPVEAIIKTMTDANLRGLGGAGFPVGRKWSILRGQEKPRLMAVNIDEGEPGTFKDRYYLEKDPHRFLEGMLIAAWVCEIDEIYIYLRDEYAAIRALLSKEITTLKNQTTIKPLPTIHLRRGAGAYICGEESAMIESIEGKRGLPRLRPPFVAEVGLFGRPTLEHNMESLYWVRDILDNGAEFFSKHGRHQRMGLRSFSVSGRVNKPGVHLAPAGITLNELIDEYCGGMQDGHRLYGYFPGGASGGILPASLSDVPLDFDTLQPYDCFIGSAAIIVFSQQDKARDLALNAIEFFQDESCGQCTPCRVGTEKAALLMQEKVWDKALLKELSQVMADASICGLGQAAQNPILSVIKYFPEELA